MRHVASLILLLTLAVDVTYGVVTLTLNSPYGCTARAVNQTTHTANETLQQSGDVNWKVLADPCFYIYYFGMLGGSALVILLMSAPKKKLHLRSWQSYRNNPEGSNTASGGCHCCIKYYREKLQVAPRSSAGYHSVFQSSN